MSPVWRKYVRRCHPLAPSQAIHRTKTGGDHTSGQDGAASEGAPATEPQPLRRPMAPARVSPAWRSDPIRTTTSATTLGKVRSPLARDPHAGGMHQ